MSYMPPCRSARRMRGPLAPIKHKIKTMRSKTFILLLLCIQSMLFAQGNCLHFDGSNDYVEVTNSPLSGDTDYTVEAWFLTEKAGSEIYSRLVGWDNFELDIAIRSNELWFDADFGWINTNVNVNDGSWHHTAITRSGNNYKMYVDGSLTNDVTNGGVRNFTGLKFRIGGKAVGGNIASTLWEGMIDEFRIWDRALTQSEIQNIDDCELIGTEPCLVGYWNFNQGTAGGSNSGLTTLNDVHSNGNDGNLNNFSLSGSTSNWISSGAGISGNCMNVVCSVLPVELIEFVGSFFDNRVNLKWSTASELNNLGFEIQKSKNARDWDNINFVEGRGTTTEVNKYQYVDLNPFSRINYYRLKQIDFDGAFEYSKVIAVEYENLKWNINVFPNPSNGLINLNVNNPSNQRMKIKISDNLGRKVWESDLIEGESNWRKEIEIKRKGIYFVTTQIGDEIQYKRIIITDEK